MNGAPGLGASADRHRSSVVEPDGDTPNLGWAPGATGDPAAQDAGPTAVLESDSEPLPRNTSAVAGQPAGDVVSSTRVPDSHPSRFSYPPPRPPLTKSALPLGLGL